MLCAALLGATWPGLAALPALPVRILAGDVYAITQGSGAPSVNESLVAGLAAQPWADVVSAEIFLLGTLRGEPVLARAADPEAYLALEDGAWIEPPIDAARGAMAGRLLADRLGLRVGEVLSLTGSTVSRLDVVPLVGLFAVGGPGDDELLVDLFTGRFLSGLGPSSFHAIRVRTLDPSTLLAFLESSGASVHVAGAGIPRADVNSAAPAVTDERVANLFLRTGVGGAPADALSSALEAAADSVRVVAYGIAFLLGALVAMDVHAIQARAFADARTTVAILRSVGAPSGWMRRRILAEGVPLAVLAGTGGAALGLLVGALLPPGAVSVFGHAVRSTFDLLTLGLIIVAITAMSATSSLLLLERGLRERPIASLRAMSGGGPPSLEVVLRG